MKHLKTFLIMLMSVAMVACGTSTTVPITGRKQNLLVGDAEINSMALQQYQQTLQSSTLSSDAASTAMVKRVGQKLATAVTNYLQNNGLAAEVKNYAWEFNLVKDKQVNAWCMPGGKIVVYEGLLPVTQDEGSLAIVLGHEIAHAVAKHSAERLSSAYRQQYGTQILGTVLAGSGLSEGTTQLIALGTSLGSQLYTSGFSRKQESEADHMGLIFAAMAGYDPRVATTFWQRMAAQGSGSSSLFSDHPSDEKRIEDIQKWMPEALKYYGNGSLAGSKKSKTGSSLPSKATRVIKIK